MEREFDKKKFIIYMVVAFGLAWILQLIACSFASRGNKGVFQAILMITMYMPFLAVLIARIPLKGMGWVPHLKGKLRWVFFAMWMPAVLSCLGALLYFIIFPGHLDTEFETLKLMMGEEALQQMEAQGMTMQIYLIVSSIQAITIVPLFNMFLALGEEVGWRGALYPYLKDKLGKTKGRCLGGIIWGAWHWPIILLAGYEYGTEYFGAPVLGPLVFCLSTVFMGILEDYIYEKTQTIWGPALLHGAINAVTIFAYMTKPEYSSYMILGPAYIGLISMVPLAALAILICVKGEKNSHS